MDPEIVTAAQMREEEAREIGGGGATGAELMERAGAGAAAWIDANSERLTTQADRRAVVFCGPGNNGGDGYVAARHLAGRGWDVRCAADAAPKAEGAPDAAAMEDLWRAGGGAVESLAAGCESLGGEAPPLCIDALFGTGLARPLGGRYAEAVRAMHRSAARVVALDIPSGIDADSGRRLGGDAAPSDIAVTFHRAKPGHFLADGGTDLRELVFVDIGMPRDRAGAARLVLGPPMSVLKDAASHKYDHGHALVLTGGFGRTGAARLAVRSALRIGAGLTTLGAPGAAMLECASQATAIMLRRCDDAGDLSELLEDDRVNAICIGPGLGLGARGRALLEVALASKRACVCDADALTLIAGEGALRDLIHPDCVLTPHGGEFARLFPDLSARLTGPASSGPAYSKLDATRGAARQIGCTVVHKGPATVIADPSGRTWLNPAVHDRSAPWLATAGTGDVLAGMIAGLLARGLPTGEAACAAVWLHVEAALTFGPGLISEDLPETLPRVLRDLASKGGGA